MALGAGRCIPRAPGRQTLRVRRGDIQSDLDEINLGYGIEIALTAWRCFAAPDYQWRTRAPYRRPHSSEAKRKHVGIDKSPQINRLEFAAPEEVQPAPQCRRAVADESSKSYSGRPSRRSASPIGSQISAWPVWTRTKPETVKPGSSSSPRKAETKALAHLRGRTDVAHPPCYIDSFRPRLCENTHEPTRRRIVSSIALSPIAATAPFVFRLTKLRRIFYAKIERLCFHTASTHDRRTAGFVAKLPPLITG